MLDKNVEEIIKKERCEIIRGLLMDLAQMDKRNEERILTMYLKY